jgi:hypothetical protein
MEIKWLKGKLRDANSASKCKWGDFQTAVPFRDRIMGKSDIEIPGQENQKVVREVGGDASFVYFCTCPDLLAEPQNELGKLGVKGAEGIGRIIADFNGCCRACPYWTLK